MQVIVRTIGPFTERLGFKELTVTLGEGSIKDLLYQLSNEQGPQFRHTVFNEQGNLRRYIKLLINGRGIHVLQGLDTPLADGDVIAIFPPVAGGAFSLDYMKL